jgi:hypothetical protein
MTVDPLKILSMRIRVMSLILFALLIVYIGFSFFLFFEWVAPSLDGRTDRHIAADSLTYITAADALREGREDDILTVALTTFPNTVLCPILLALVFKSTFAMVLADYAMFFLVLVLLRKSFSFSTGVFVGLLLLNATTTISLLSVNKEIVDLLAVSIFFFARRRHHKSLLLLALMLAIFNRFEVCIVMLVFLLAESKLNPWRHRRVITMVALTVVMSVTLPLFLSETLNSRLEVISDSRIYAWINGLEMHYLFAFAVIPKVVHTLFSIFITHPFNVETYYRFSDIANTSIPCSNNLANAVVFVILAWKRRLSVQSDLVYFSMLGFIIMAVSMVTVERYIYFAYVLLCLHAAQSGIGEPARDISLHKQGGRGRYASLPDNNEVAFG